MATVLRIARRRLNRQAAPGGATGGCHGGATAPAEGGATGVPAADQAPIRTGPGAVAPPARSASRRVTAPAAVAALGDGPHEVWLCLAWAAEPLAQKEIMRRTQMAETTVRRHLQALAEVGAADRTEHGWAVWSRPGGVSA